MKNQKISPVKAFLDTIELVLNLSQCRLLQIAMICNDLKSSNATIVSLKYSCAAVNVV